MTPLEVAANFATILDRVSVPYVIGGSTALLVVGEPRLTLDVDVAVRMGMPDLDRLVAATPDFYVPTRSAEEAVRAQTSFNVVPMGGGTKLDLFLLGDGLLDRNQLERRRPATLPAGATVWVTAAEDVVLRKLEWFLLGGEVSDRQWRDVVGVLRVQRGALDEDYLDRTAVAVGLSALLSRARADAD